MKFVTVVQPPDCWLFEMEDVNLVDPCCCVDDDDDDDNDDDDDDDLMNFHSL